jgi:hypothetical protein
MNSCYGNHTGSIGAKSGIPPCDTDARQGLEHNGHLVPTVPLGDQVTPDAHTWRGVRTGWTLLRVNAGRRPTRFFPITTWLQASPAGVRLGVVQRRARRRPLSLLIGPVVL